MIRSLFNTYRIICAHGKIKVKDLAEKEAHIKRTQVFKHIRFLERAGLVRRFRMDRHTVVIATDYVDRETFEKRIRSALRKRIVYDVAEEIKEKIEEYGIPADFLGACKIHEEVEEHSRITSDINIVVPRESYKYLDLLLKSMGYAYHGPSELLYADHTYFVPEIKATIYVTLDGIKHPMKKGTRFYDLSPVLRAKGHLDLEHAVAGKFLVIPSIRRKADGYDISVALAHGVNLKKVVEILSTVLEGYPELGSVIANNIGEVEAYLHYYSDFDAYSIEKIRYGLKYIAHNLGILRGVSKRVKVE
jgi:predicted transcriptional regulator